MELSIIMPCYKGEKFIENSIRTTEKIVSEFCKDFEIIVVVDGFVDNSYRIAKNLEKEFKNLKVVGYEKNRGKGFAIRYGLKFAEGEYIAFLDSDLDICPSSLKYYFETMKKENVDMVIGNRRDKNSVWEYPKLRKFLSYCFNIYVNIIFPELRLNDTQTGIKMFKREVIKDIFSNLPNFNSIDGYTFDIAILVLARKKGYKIKEMPCIVKKEDAQNISGVNLLKVIYKMGKDVIQLKRILG
ncbi:hypothetical protein J422_03503 [Methanocaldococcus villosus KIN24-T80]|uniref:Glycosyltransferase 2-like domain-containing protein n=1 Tax=Methanocaldococcus villosus KIN24-T80 TaxID=1069083 RepID=N6VSR0_9EURY|nr:glycosyltransferase [Methanocaldococcus villosus]ENN96231.1 hypothetical protein J422_03503 [Methanocaldococcus villosus KIN24-T80]